MSLFAWRGDNEYGYASGILARSPHEFKHAFNISNIGRTWTNPEFSMTNKGLKIEVISDNGRKSILPLNCYEDVRHASGHPIELNIKLMGSGIMPL